MAPGTQWSQKPIASLPAACGCADMGMATAQPEAAVVARKRRRVSLLSSMAHLSRWFARAELPFVATVDVATAAGFTSVTGAKLRSKPLRLSV